MKERQLASNCRVETGRKDQRSLSGLLSGHLHLDGDASRRRRYLGLGREGDDGEGAVSGESGRDGLRKDAPRQRDQPDKVSLNRSKVVLLLSVLRLDHNELTNHRDLEFLRLVVFDIHRHRDRVVRRLDRLERTTETRHIAESAASIETRGERRREEPYRNGGAEVGAGGGGRRRETHTGRLLDNLLLVGATVGRIRVEGRHRVVPVRRVRESARVDGRRGRGVDAIVPTRHR
ncbi:hypothetical protein PFISCL1PPCAC_17283 [Pristionchus fissidentatus]|uniref:Ribosomal protein n=1 Tax=Pristionchus fissidentatus TaxID=1538716 RepID=A0AAV5W5C6_9BILA|nr:hypothetical protein PFISCL1PPCAC_17283 [Pristionchus fissidentatus]